VCLKCRVNVVIFHKQRAVVVEDARDALGPKESAVGPVVLGQLLVRVTPQLVWEALIVLESLILGRSIEADTDDVHTQGLEVRVHVAEPATFESSPPCGRRRVEPDDLGRPHQIRLCAVGSV
jgi:hypothetical protein